MTEQTSGRPWGGFDSLEAQIDTLRCGRFRVGRTFLLAGRGLVAQGTITEGIVAAGKVLLVHLERYPNVCTPLKIHSVESVIDSDDSGKVGLVLGTVEQVTSGQAVNLWPGTLVEVLDRPPAA